MKADKDSQNGVVLGSVSSSFFVNTLNIDTCFIRGIIHLIDEGDTEKAKAYLVGMLRIAQGDLSFDFTTPEWQESGDDTSLDKMWQRSATIARRSVIKTFVEDMEYGRFSVDKKDDSLPILNSPLPMKRRKKKITNAMCYNWLKTRKTSVAKVIKDNYEIGWVENVTYLIRRIGMVDLLLG